MSIRINSPALPIVNADAALKMPVLKQGPEEEAYEVFTRYQGYLTSQDAALITVALKQFVALQQKHPNTLGCRKFRAEVTRFMVGVSKEYLGFAQVGIETFVRPMGLVGVSVMQDLKSAIDVPVIESVVTALNAAENKESFQTIQMDLQKKIEDFFRVGMLVQAVSPFDLESSAVFQTLDKIPTELTAFLFAGSNSIAANIFQKYLTELDPQDYVARARLFANFIFVVGRNPETFNPGRFISEARVAYVAALNALNASADINVAARGTLAEVDLEYAAFCLKVGAFEDLPAIISNIVAYGSESQVKRLKDLVLKLNGYENLNRDPLANAIAPWVFLLAAKIMNREVNMDAPLKKIMDATRPAMKQVFLQDAAQVNVCLQRLKPFFQTIQDEGVAQQSSTFFKALVSEVRSENNDTKAKAIYDEALKLMEGSVEEIKNGK